MRDALQRYFFNPRTLVRVTTDGDADSGYWTLVLSRGDLVAQKRSATLDDAIDAHHDAIDAYDPGDAYE